MQPLLQPGGSTVTPGTMVPGLLTYTDPLTSRFPGEKDGRPWPPAAAPGPAAAISEPVVRTVSAPTVVRRQRDRRDVGGGAGNGVIGRQTSLAWPAQCWP